MQDMDAVMPQIPNPPRPESDWTCREVLDAKAVDPAGQSQCEFCGTAIRWIHVLEHDDYHRAVETGCCCAIRLCFDYDAETAERELKNRTARLTRFVDPRRWKRSINNPENIWRFVRCANGSKIRVTVFMRDGSYGICIAAMKGDGRRFHPERYGSQAEAKSIAFELVDGLKEQNE